MKKVIDGKVYNTETAELIAEWRNGLGWGDFNNREEGLYRTKKGAWFLSGEGGPMTKWSQSAGNMTSGGSGIEPLTKKQALYWMEAHGDPDDIQIYFRDLVEEA